MDNTHIESSLTNEAKFRDRIESLDVPWIHAHMAGNWDKINFSHLARDYNAAHGTNLKFHWFAHHRDKYWPAKVPKRKANTHPRKVSYRKAKRWLRLEPEGKISGSALAKKVEKKFGVKIDKATALRMLKKIAPERVIKSTKVKAVVGPQQMQLFVSYFPDNVQFTCAELAQGIEKQFGVIMTPSAAYNAVERAKKALKRAGLKPQAMAVPMQQVA